MIEGLVRALRAAREFGPRDYLPLRLGAGTIGWVRRDLAGRLRAWAGIFEFSGANVCLRPAEEAALSAALAEVARALAREGHIQGWRDETYTIRANEGGVVLFQLERAAMRFFGLTSSAAHLNGFFMRNENPSIWVARRSATKAIDPGMLDNLVAGGVASGQNAWQTLMRECGEEAGIPASLAQHARPAGLLHVCRDVPEGLNSEILHIHDLALPEDFTPRNTDGEVSQFLSLDAQMLMERVAGGEMTVEAALVAADFVLRQGALQDGGGEVRAAIDACRVPMLT